MLHGSFFQDILSLLHLDVSSAISNYNLSIKV